MQSLAEQQLNHDQTAPNGAQNAANSAYPRSAWRPSAATATQTCNRCIYDSNTPAITFDTNGECNYCKVYDQLNDEYPIGEAGDRVLEAMAKEIKAGSRRKKYDVIVGVSGGCDSSYLLHKTIQLGLRPLAVHFDNTWDSRIAVENIHNVLKKLNVDLYTHVVDNLEYNDLYRSFMKAGVPDIEAPTDIALAATLYRACDKYGIKYMIEGHSFRTEGISPLGWLYMDGKYIDSVQKKFGTMKLKTYPNLWMNKFLKWTVWNGVKKFRPLYYMDYHKENTKKFLAQEFGWQWYGGHHLENRFTAFYHTFFLPQRFGIDQRSNGFSALIRCGQMDRAQALAEMQQHPVCDPEIVQLVKKRLGFSDQEFDYLIYDLPKHSFREFKTYKQTFEKMRPFFWLMYKLNRVPKSFYIKYTSKQNI